MSKVLAVFGATGQQGSSVVNYVLADPELSKEYKIRAVTRDVTSDKAKELIKRGVEVVQGDVLDKASLDKALAGVHTVFAMTTPAGFEVEYNSGKTIADASVAQHAEYIIFSTLPPVREISGGKYTKVFQFEAKAAVEQYIRGLPIKSAFFSPGSFMENFHTFLAPQPDADGTFALSFHISPQAQLPLIAAIDDTGKFIGAILAQPDKYAGTTWCANTALYSMEDIAAALSKASGKTVVFKQIPVEVFTANVPIEPEMMTEVFSYLDEFGYYGPESKKLVAWAAENARGKLLTLDEYFEAHPLHLA